MTSKYNFDNDFSINKVLYQNNDTLVSMKTNAYTKLNVETKQHLPKDAFTWNSNLKNGFKTSVTYAPNDKLKLTFAGNGSYTISTKQDLYSYGAGLNANIRPFGKRPYPNINLGIDYQKSDVVDAKNTKNLDEKITFDGSTSFNKYFSINGSYELHLDDNNENKAKIGAKIDF